MRPVRNAAAVLAIQALLAAALIGCGGGGSTAEQVQLREANMIFYSMPG